MVRISSDIELGYFTEWPRASFDAFLIWVIWVAAMGAPMDHVFENEVAYVATLCGKFA